MPDIQTPSKVAKLDAEAQRSRRLKLVRRWGTFTQAYSTAKQPGLEHFWHGDCYLAYQQKWHVACVLADPVGPPEDHAALLHAFLKKFRKTCFWQITRTTTQILQDARFWINEIGVDTRLELADYNFAGKKKERLRHATNWLTKNHFEIREGSFARDINVEEIRVLSDSWQASRRIRGTVRFFNRPIVFIDEPDVRKFFLFDSDGRPVAFVFFDPIYRDGNVIGYSPSIKRRLPDAPLRAEEGIMKRAIEQFQCEDIEQVMLGLSPLLGITDQEFRSNWLIHFSWSRGLKAKWLNKYFYNLAGHADFKRRFCGIEEPTYYASDIRWNDLRVIATMRLAGVL